MSPMIHIVVFMISCSVLQVIGATVIDVAPPLQVPGPPSHEFFP